MIIENTLAVKNYNLISDQMIWINRKIEKQKVDNKIINSLKA